MWILVFALVSAPQPAFVSGYQSKAECEAAIAHVIDGTSWHARRAAFCMPGPGATEKHEH